MNVRNRSRTSRFIGQLAAEPILGFAQRPDQQHAFGNGHSGPVGGIFPVVSRQSGIDAHLHALPASGNRGHAAIIEANRGIRGLTASSRLVADEAPSPLEVGPATQGLRRLPAAACGF